MVLDFSGIVKKRVPFVPYVHEAEPQAKSVVLAPHDSGHAPQSTMASVSTPPPTGHSGHVGTRLALGDVLNISHCCDNKNDAHGHGGHMGHALTEEDAAYFDERAAIAEFHGELSRADAEALAINEQRRRNIYH